MKKLILFAVIGALAFTACKKAEAPLNPGSPVASISSEDQGRALFKQTNPDLYNQVYNSTVKGPKPTKVIICPGTFTFSHGDPTNGTCLRTSSTCYIVVVFSSKLNAPPVTTTTLTSNYSETYDAGTAQMTLNTVPSQQFYITSLNVTFNASGDANTSWTVH